MATITEKPAVILDKDYIKHVTSAQRAGGTVSRSLCAAAVKAGNIAVTSKRLFEWNDFLARRDNAPASIKRLFNMAINAIYGLALGKEEISKQGIVSYKVAEEACKAASLLEADQKQYEHRSPLLKHLDAVRVKIVRTPKTTDLDTLLGKAATAFAAYIKAGGTLDDFLAEVAPEMPKSDNKANNKADNKADKAA